MIDTCHRLRKTPLVEFSIDDLRVMIGQSIGLEYLVPMPIEVLHGDIFAEGELYEGDLLNSILSSDVKYWLTNTKNWETICALFETHELELKAFDTTWEIKKRWFALFAEFKQINS